MPKVVVSKRTCDVCGHDYKTESTEIIDLPHLVACKAILCLDCIRAVAPYDDFEEMGTGIELFEEDEDGDS